MSPHRFAAPTPADWSAHDGVPLLHTIATAVMRLAENTDLEAFTLPYPAEAQRALDRTVLSCLLRDADPPTSLSELLEWCRSRPLDAWPLDLPPDAFSPGDYLIDPVSLQPSQLCQEWKVRGWDSAAEQYDRAIIREALRMCRESESPESYTAFRRLLVEKPVLTTTDMFEVSTDLTLDPVRGLVELIYKPVPDGYRSHGAYVTCARCLTLLTPLADGGWWCERDRCRRQGPPVPGRELPVDEVGGLWQLERPLRQFVTGPGRAEAELERGLKALRLPVEMWPGFDAYDLRVTFPDGWAWAIDVKDWAQPALLGQAATAVRTEPPYNEACWVVPGHRVDARHDYIQVYARNRTDTAQGLPLLTDRELVAAARARLRGDTGPAFRLQHVFDGKITKGRGHA
ncbi:pPIWI_RE_Y domain-containing protein [Sphaerisporangium aureirubrum]|uniref:Fis family transcriptional regulator n=1 Tax=Sphaerisporangium aureirubrum TaxID=1544736 RepID=A0ABW1NMK5_9ACTN